MRLEKLLGTAPMLFFLLCALTELSEGPARAFDHPPTNNGEPLTPDQKQTVSDAITHIGSGPGTLAWNDVHNNPHSAPCTTIARELMDELNRKGGIEQETADNTYNGWEYQGNMNINDDFLGEVANGDASQEHLCEVLIHEWVHKQQEGEDLRCQQCANEVEANDAELAYKDSVGISNTEQAYISAWLYEIASFLSYLNWLTEDYIAPKWENDLIVELRQGEEGNSDQCACYHLGDTTASIYDFGPMRCSDLHVLEDFFPNGNGMALVCGFIPDAGGSLQMLELSDSGVVGPFMILDFPQYFYSMERFAPDNSWMIVDTSTVQIYRMEDTNSDQLPDVISGVFASAAQFPQLEGMRSVQLAEHPLFGIGLVIHPEPLHQSHLIKPYDRRWFLVDADGDHFADACLQTRRCEYLHILPAIRIPPSAGDLTLKVSGTWLHDIAVYSTDEMGDVLFEMLGVVNLSDSIKVSCPLSRVLLPGEFVIPVDMMTGERPPLPDQVREDGSPTALVIQYNPETGMFCLSWEPVPGALMYALYASDDGIEYFDTGLRTMESFLEYPLPPMTMQHFRVTAIR